MRGGSTEDLCIGTQRPCHRSRAACRVRPAAPRRRNDRFDSAAGARRPTASATIQAPERRVHAGHPHERFCVWHGHELTSAMARGSRNDSLATFRSSRQCDSRHSRRAPRGAGWLLCVQRDHGVGCEAVRGRSAHRALRRRLGQRFGLGRALGIPVLSRSRTATLGTRTRGASSPFDGPTAIAPCRVRASTPGRAILVTRFGNEAFRTSAPGVK